MLTRLPDSVRQAWGEAVVHDFTAWIEEAMTDETVHRVEWDEVLAQLKKAEVHTGERFAAVDKRFDQAEARTDARFAAVEARLDKAQALADARFTAVDVRLDRIETEIGDFRREVTERFDRLYEFNTKQARWTLGTLALFCSLVVVMLAIIQTKP